MAQVILDQTCTYRQMLKFLRNHDIDTRAFGRPGSKTLRELYEELQSRDARLIWDDIVGRVIRFAFSAKLLISTPWGYLLELGRICGTGEPRWNLRGWTISGTRKMSFEGWIATIQWETYEEIGVVLDSTDFMSYPFSSEGPEEAIPTAHESSVYPGILSLVVMKRFIFQAEKHFSLEKIREIAVMSSKEIYDGRTKIFLGYFSSIPEPSIEDLNGKVLFEHLFGESQIIFF